ncbi:UPF0262 family protein [Pacificimonas flava]|uniref:UPF0262 protein C725_1039 n=1 Tax=Pacificimonas flava TaxID=1234595 RepID=M2U7V5_9SPHN|nr:UPF0262 family protein [Pacificimonas flava]EMD84067.1 hypothetical protein C725_1039 [Pacificimonas flava]MBB5280960.1 uncharacterized protein (UPF0262 family) [Pacificimonas flava]
MSAGVPDHRIIDIALDERTILWRSADIEQERRVAIFDLLEGNSFRLIEAPDGGGADVEGPYRILLHVRDGRLAIDVKREDDSELATVVVPLSPFRRTIRDYFAICESYYQAIRERAPHEIEAIDMARRGIHNEAADLLKDRLGERIEVDFDTARRLFTLICVLHIRG